MDETEMVRRLLAEPPPARHVVAEGRARLLRTPAGALKRTGMRRRAIFRSALALGLTAAAVVLLSAPLVPGVGSSPGGGAPFVSDASARSVLLAAAVHAESAPTHGTYWHVRSRTTTTLPQAYGRGENRYALEQLSAREEWTTRSGHAWAGSREWVRPKTPQDEAAWRRDGAPSTWCIGKTDTEPPKPICLHTAPGTASLTKDYFPFEVAEGLELTFAQLQRLPQDADALHGWLVGITRRDLDPSASADVVDTNVTQILADLLVYPPVPPRVRAAAFRALADMPNVTSTGSTRDQLGRPGIGIAITESGGLVGGLVGPDGRVAPAVRGCRADETAGQPQRGCAPPRLTHTLIIDPVTSHVLADETRIANSSHALTRTLILDVGWTDENPHEPASG
jgi:hypothetical protein